MTTSLSEKAELTEAEIKHYKQQYATPWSFIDWVIDEVLVPRGRGFFGIDVCASQDNAKAASWYDEEGNGLDAGWTNPQHGPAWCNPPFRDVAPWLDKARTEADEYGVMSCVLTHMDHSTEWFSEGMAMASECILVNPRINFVQHPLLLKYMKENGIKPGGNDKQNVLWVFDPAWLPSGGDEQAKITYPKPWR
jgi:phage N-6-adenine-methyltransferase